MVFFQVAEKNGNEGTNRNTYFSLDILRDDSQN